MPTAKFDGPEPWLAVLDELLQRPMAVEVLRDRLSESAIRQVAAAEAEHVAADGRITLTHDELARECGLDRRTVERIRATWLLLGLEALQLSSVGGEPTRWMQMPPNPDSGIEIGWEGTR